MSKLLKQFTIFLSIWILVGAPLNAVARDFWQPVTIAPDLKIISAEFGAFPAGKGPKDKKGKAVAFIPTENIDKDGFSYGWRIKLETPRKVVHVYQVWGDHAKEESMQLGAAETIVDGYIYRDWDEVGAKQHRHSVTAYIEGKPEKTFVYFTH